MTETHLAPKFSEYPTGNPVWDAHILYPPSEFICPDDLHFYLDSRLWDAKAVAPDPALVEQLVELWRVAQPGSEIQVEYTIFSDSGVEHGVGVLEGSKLTRKNQ
jgi:hypothetical protein